ncbi:5'-3' exoribonuclease 3 [Zea mays]|uniref:5'-3' exoribonuclease 3 n=1 Tax=Zea mays TaxID=4577 RepID=A0A1D6JAP8_MAIZE|nr:5'-3' exoribonuclease 3 [Zea mays]
MGIPSFYKWVVSKYPSIISPVKDEPEECPDGIIYDNLYLDMNCIIHCCFHPQDQLTHADIDVRPPTTANEVFESMFEYMDRLFRIVRPTSLLYLAVDGVAPFAKMNRIRRGRFHSAMERLAEEPPREISEVSDPNVISPGTEFMEKVSEALEYYIRARFNSDPWWRDIMVILSDASVPGEGEHKIMSFIRAQCSMEGYDPNTRHCLFGHDADLIMLALASHEVYFSILREFLNMWVLREYLEIEFKILDPVCETDIERLIDDFIFICFLMGNDFIPHIPSLKTQEGAVDLLIEVYKTTFNKMGGYITNTDKDSLLETYHEMLREAPESERPELRQKLDDLLFNEENPYDSIRLGLPGWKSRFFREHFGAKTSSEIGKLQNDMAQKYLEGLCWVLQCYFADVPSWSWYYPFYVAPFVSDLKGLSRIEISFTVDKPLRPFDQLMAVLPMQRHVHCSYCWHACYLFGYSHYIQSNRLDEIRNFFEEL